MFNDIFWAGTTHLTIKYICKNWHNLHWMSCSLIFSIYQQLLLKSTLTWRFFIEIQRLLPALEDKFSPPSRITYSAYHDILTKIYLIPVTEKACDNFVLCKWSIHWRKQVSYLSSSCWWVAPHNDMLRYAILYENDTFGAMFSCAMPSTVS